jgi:hypothetical protein
MNAGTRFALVALVILLASAVVVAQEWPSLKQGMWEISRTMQAPGGGAPKVVNSKRCMDPVADWKQQNARMGPMGCTFSPMKKTGASYTFTASCNVMGTSSKTTTIIVPEGDGAYTLTVTGTTDGEPTNETMKAKWTGACTK